MFKKEHDFDKRRKWAYEECDGDEEEDEDEGDNGIIIIIIKIMCWGCVVGESWKMNESTGQPASSSSSSSEATTSPIVAEFCSTIISHNIPRPPCSLTEGDNLNFAVSATMRTGTINDDNQNNSRNTTRFTSATITIKKGDDSSFISKNSG